MKQAKWISALMLLLLPLIAVGQMKPAERIVTQVPFKFMVGNAAIEAAHAAANSAFSLKKPYPG